MDNVAIIGTEYASDSHSSDSVSARSPNGGPFGDLGLMDAEYPFRHVDAGLPRHLGNEAPRRSLKRYAVQSIYQARIGYRSASLVVDR
jgi:hypothetical protein